MNNQSIQLHIKSKSVLFVNLHDNILDLTRHTSFGLQSTPQIENGTYMRSVFDDKTPEYVPASVNFGDRVLSMTATETLLHQLWIGSIQLLYSKHYRHQTHTIFHSQLSSS